METVTIGMAGSAFASALERVLPGRGYRAIRSFDLRLDDAGAGDSCCDFMVLQVFRESPAGGWVGAISVRGWAGGSTVSLTAAEGDDDLAAQFAPMVVEAASGSSILVAGNAMQLKNTQL